MLISPLLYIKWFSVDVLISLVTGIEPDLFILSFENYWNCLSLFEWQGKRKKKERIQIVSESFSALSWPAGHQAKSDIPGDRVRSIRLRGRQCCAAKESMANTRFMRKMHYLAWEVLSRWSGRHSPMTALGNPPSTLVTLQGSLGLHGEMCRFWFLWDY